MLELLLDLKVEARATVVIPRALARSQNITDCQIAGIVTPTIVLFGIVAGFFLVEEVGRIFVACVIPDHNLIGVGRVRTKYRSAVLPICIGVVIIIQSPASREKRTNHIITSFDLNCFYARKFYLTRGCHRHTLCAALVEPERIAVLEGHTSGKVARVIAPTIVLFGIVAGFLFVEEVGRVFTRGIIPNHNLVSTGRICSIGELRVRLTTAREEIVDLDGRTLAHLFEVHGEHVIAGVDVDRVVADDVRGSDVREGYCRAEGKTCYNVAYGRRCEYNARLNKKRKEK